MVREDLVSMVREDITGAVKSGLLSGDGCVWFRDGGMLWMNRSNSSLVNLTPDDFISIPVNSGADMPDALTGIASSVMNKNRHINVLILNRAAYSKTVCETGETLKPYVDDIAQIIGIDIKSCMQSDTGKITKLFRSRSAVTIKGEGILCSGSCMDDAVAAAIIAEKGALIHVQGGYLGKLHFIGRLESALMRFVYVRKYSRQASKAGR